jgi:hypothetical protein
MGIGILYVSEWFIAPFFMVIAGAYFFLHRITCPNCGTPVTFQGVYAGIRIQGGWIRQRCQECGWDIRNNP